MDGAAPPHRPAAGPIQPAPTAPVSSAAPAASPAPSRKTPRGRYPTPSGDELREMLQDGISEIGRLDEQPLSAPAELPDETVVPIDELLYRGRGALRRAVELRDEIRQRGGAAAPETLAELFDLLELALAD